MSTKNLWALLTCLLGVLAHGIEAQIEHQNYTYMMVVGGYSTPQTATVIDHSASNEPCRRLPDLPEPMRDAVGTFINGKPLVCDTFNLQCYTFVLEDEAWQHEPPMIIPGPRNFAKGVKVSKDEFWIVGGASQSGKTLIDMHRLTTNSSKFQLFDYLPEEFLFKPTIVPIDDRVLIAGGQGSNKTWIYSISTQEYTEIAPMPQDRKGALGGAAINFDRETVDVVIVGGTASDGNPNPLTTSNILDLNTLSWREGPFMPIPILDGSVVPLGPSFATVGGFSDNVKGVYRYQQNSEGWEDLQRELEHGYQNVVAFGVPDEYCIL